MPEAKLDMVRAPRTQQQRREETRRALLDAAVESLIEVGFARTTTLEVQRRAEVSRGALLHHFPSKAELLVAAVDHLAEMRAREIKAFAAQLPPDPGRIDRFRPAAKQGEGPARGESPCGEGPPRGDRGEDGPGPGELPAPGGDARTGAVLGLLWQCFSGTFFKVSMELRTAARTDPELRRVLTGAERQLRDRIVAQSRTLFGRAVAEHPGLERALDLTLQLMIGAAMTSVLHGETSRLDELIEDWKALFPLVLDPSRRDRFRSAAKQGSDPSRRDRFRSAAKQGSDPSRIDRFRSAAKQGSESPYGEGPPRGESPYGEGPPRGESPHGEGSPCGASVGGAVTTDRKKLKGNR